jgi:hypothetical protein
LNFQVVEPQLLLLEDEVVEVEAVVDDDDNVMN